ncbi:MAG: alanine--tRNA ligase [Patescibacteria group bacterium]|nr:alanine--tRNA ligase [Patescibacteria group bacterium]
MTANELRQKYLDFFKARGHAIIPSASLLPENDSTLLFTNSGMFPLVPYLLGEKHPAGIRLVDSQKSFRTEDIEEVGDSRHNTFFEMLGNWSLGDYFKKEQLAWWLEFLFVDLKLNPARIYQTVYAGSEDGQIAKDEESITILQELFTKYGVSAEEGPATTGKGALGSGQELDFSKQRIFAYRDKNWWQRGDAVGELGGPDSETFYDTGKEHDLAYGPHCHPNCDCGRFLEIGNSVFMQYQKTANAWQELKNKNVDFGGGLERILMVLSGQDSIFKTDLFTQAIARIEELSGKKYADDKRAFEVIADHLKAATFIVGDDRGVPPSNTDQGYIVRRLLRRAIRYGRQIGISQDRWLKAVAQIFIEDYAAAYPELKNNQEFIFNEFDKEEEKFERTLEKGMIEFKKLAAHDLDGVAAFNLYQSYGFPLEITEELANEHGLKVDRQGFMDELKKHQELSRTASAGKFKGGLADHSEETTKLHTAAHLLLAALRQVLGDHVSQKGSNITAERLRFDFSHPEKMTPEQIAAVEELVNGAIGQGLDVAFEEIPLSEAKETGATGVFDSKYGDVVKVYTVGHDNGGRHASWDNIFSREICGGPHVSSLKGLGSFKIQKEEASSAGVRRIKAVLV